METITYWIGLIVVSLLAIYVVFYVLYLMIKPSVNPKDCKIPMPVLRPVPIPTKNQPTPIHKLTVFIFEVRKWEVVENWHYQYQASGENIELFIPKGFIFDGASIPRPFWAILNPIGLLLIQGLLHDYAYKYQQLWQVSDGRATAYKKDADKEVWDTLFKNVGREVNGFFLINGIAWAAVALGGSGAWNEHRKAGLQADKPDMKD
ncbi:MAG: DUF1353 domain-containing protein [Methylococcaceae bacterium]